MIPDKYLQKEIDSAPNDPPVKGQLLYPKERIRWLDDSGNWRDPIQGESYEKWYDRQQIAEAACRQRAEAQGRAIRISAMEREREISRSVGRVIERIAVAIGWLVVALLILTALLKPILELMALFKFIWT